MNVIPFLVCASQSTDKSPGTLSRLGKLSPQPTPIPSQILLSPADRLLPPSDAYPKRRSEKKGSHPDDGTPHYYSWLTRPQLFHQFHSCWLYHPPSNGLV